MVSMSFQKRHEQYGSSLIACQCRTKVSGKVWRRRYESRVDNRLINQFTAEGRRLARLRWRSKSNETAQPLFYDSDDK